jgi:phage/plasmid-like protein (TIGR03299 family)
MTANYSTGFSVREAMWHGLGEVLPENPSFEELPKLAGWPTEVVRTPVYAQGASEPVEGYAMLTAKWDDGTSRFLHPQADSYGIVQPRDVGDILEAIAGEGGIIETAGMLKDYKQMWALARLPKEYEVPGDDSPYLGYVSVHNSYDGSLSLQAARHGVRVVCANTQDLALTEAANRGTLYRWKHTTNVKDRIEEAKKVILATDQAMQEWLDRAKELTKKKVTARARDEFLEAFVPAPPPALVTDRAMKNVEEGRAAVKAILRGDTGTVAPKLGHTAYGLWCAGVEYLDYIRPSRSQTTMFGRAILTPDKGKEKVMQLAMAAAS